MTTTPEAEATMAEIEAWGELADELDRCLHKLLSYDVTANHFVKAELAEHLWDNKGGIIRALRAAALSRPAPAAEVTGEQAITFGQFSIANRERCESANGFGHPLNGWSSSDWMTALVGEVGEAANVVKKLNRYRDGVPGNKLSESELQHQLRKELGDVFVYLDLMAQSLGFSIADAAVEVFNAKSADIGYPTKFATPSPDAGRVPEGFQLVPKTLSAEMLAAFDHYNDSHVSGAWTFQECWDEVLATSPAHDEVKS